MSLSKKLLELYFDSIYNPVYDFTTAQIVSYRRLQAACVDKLQFEPNDKLLCVGVGTGNEILLILERNSQVDIVGIDISPAALRRAAHKVRKQGKQVRLLQMDANRLEFDDENFDKAFCFHVMDFVENVPKVTAEILRVLKREGQFVLTYPSAGEGLRLGMNLLTESLSQNSGSFKAFVKLLLTFVGAGVVYAPLLFRGNQRAYSRSQLEAMFAELSLKNLDIEEDATYHDFVVYGRK
jgi:ubiquinone/menaquinone biosynthesis C-methylase UbiE